jgi:hypothetical protein
MNFNEFKVAYDAKHQVWIIAGLAFTFIPKASAISISRSLDGGKSWRYPIYASIATSTQSYDKEWIVCDNFPSSPYYGHCYVQWDDSDNGNRMYTATSTDGRERTIAIYLSLHS